MWWRSTSPGAPTSSPQLYLESFPARGRDPGRAGRPEEQAELARDLTEFFRNEYAAGGVRYDYLLVRATVV